jgi:hypothetical protein
MPRPIVAPLIAVLILIGGCASPISSPSAVAPSPSPTLPAASTQPSPAAATPVPSSRPGPSGSIDPANFTTTIDNPWFPLTPGTTLTYKGTKDGEPAVDVVRVTTDTKVVGGVKCVVIQDRLTLSGRLAETTLDYYTQDLAGNVWYFGEDTQELNEMGAVVSREGTWHAGVDGAIPGIFMNSDPMVGDTFTQELYKGHAEDHFQVLDLSAPIKVPYGSFSDALLTKEWTPLEPDVLDNKYYVRGLGEVKEVSVKGPLERLELVKVVRP